MKPFAGVQNDTPKARIRRGVLYEPNQTAVEMVGQARKIIDELARVEEKMDNLHMDMIGLQERKKDLMRKLGIG